MQKSESIAELAKALSAFQGELKAAPKDNSNTFFKSHYADLATIWETCRGPLARHGLAVSQLPFIEGERIALDTLLMHSSGEWLLSSLLLTPTKSDPQSVGSAITYARRYSLSAILGIVADEDDDAEAAMGRPAEPSTTRMPQAMAVAPKGLCPVHHVPFVRHQGTSKAGKPFDFWSCPQKSGDGYCKERPEEAQHTGGADTVLPRTLGDLMTLARDRGLDSPALLARLTKEGWRTPDGQEGRMVSDVVPNTPQAVAKAWQTLITQTT